MKKLFTLLFALTFVFATGLIAQNPTVTIGNETGTSPVDVPVDFDFNGASIGSFDLTISYDESLITNVQFVAGSITFTDIPVISYPNPGEFRVNWSNTSGQELTGTGNFYLRFTGNAIGSSDLDFVTPNTENITELGLAGSGDIVTATFTNGSVTFDALPIPFKNWAVYLGFGLIFAFVIVRFRRLF